MKTFDAAFIRVLKEVKNTDSSEFFVLWKIANDNKRPAAERIAARAIIRDSSVLKMEEDGGPGSGNWGHAGRPSLVGGSAPGGGLAFRTGSPVGGYSSVKRDPNFEKVRDCAKISTYGGFIMQLISVGANDILRKQHRECGTSEDYTAYTRRIYNLLHGYMESKRRGGKSAPKKKESEHVIAEWSPDKFTSYTRRGTEFPEDIKDVVDHLGFDGKPKVLSHDEFEEYRKANPDSPLLFRSYRASDETTLKSYDEQLDDGEWYVDCSAGGHQYGKGMYTVGVYDRKTDYWPGVYSEMTHYSGLRGMAASSTRAMMLDPSAKIFKPSSRIPAWGSDPLKEELKRELAAHPEKYTRAGSADDPMLNVENYKASPLAKQIVEEETEDILKRFDGLQSEESRGVYERGMKSLAKQSEKLAKMKPEERKELIHAFVEKVEDVHIRNIAIKNVGRSDASLDSHSRWDKRISGAMDYLSEENILEAALSVCKTKQMALFLARLYKNPGDRYALYARYNRRTEHNFKEIVNRSAFNVEDLDCGALAALMGYDAIDSWGHGRTGSYTVVLNRTKVIIDKDRVDLGKRMEG